MLDPSASQACGVACLPSLSTRPQAAWAAWAASDQQVASALSVAYWISTDIVHCREILHGDIIPSAYLWFTGEAVGEEDDEEDDVDDEDDEDHDEARACCEGTALLDLQSIL